MACFYFFPLTFLRFFPGPSGKPGQNDEKGGRLVFVTPRKDIMKNLRPLQNLKAYPRYNKPYRFEILPEYAFLVGSG